METPRDGYCCGRYASYWNAFLFGVSVRTPPVQVANFILGQSAQTSLLAPKRAAIVKPSQHLISNRICQHLPERLYEIMSNQSYNFTI